MKSFRFLLLWSVLLFSIPACDIVKQPVDPEPTNSQQTQAALRIFYDAIQREATVPPHAARIFGYAGVALYEGVVQGYPSHRSLVGQVNGLSALPKASAKTLNWEAVGIKAASYVFLELLKQNKTPNTATTEAVNNILPASTSAASLSYGETLGKAILEWANQDGFLASRGKSYTSPTGTGLWIPTAPAFAAPLEPYWGTLRPFVMKTDYSECVPTKPHPYSTDPSSPYYQEVKQVYDVSKNLTDEQRAIANFWADGPGATGTPPGHWVLITRQMMEEKSLTAIEAAELYVKTSLALNDAFMAGWYCKYRFSLLRPITAIRELIDPNWSPLLTTPNFPEYISGHSVGSGAASAVLTQLLGSFSFTDKTKVAFGQGTRGFASFRAAAEEAAVSRLYGGIHFVSGNHRGVQVGDCVGELVNSRISTR